MNDPQFKLDKSALPKADDITLGALQHLVSIYNRVLLASPQQKRHRISPVELQRLDDLRYRHLPEKLRDQNRVNDVHNPGLSISKPELQDLMQWKLARGVYRPTLPSLIARNSTENVPVITKDAFSVYGGSNSDSEVGRVADVVKKLCELQGVGPATASLLMAVAYPESLPFFSDELFYWTAATSGAVRLEKIKYDMKEYKQIVTEVKAIQDRLEKANNGDRPRADDIERAAYVIQKLQNPDIWKAVHDDGANVAGSGSSESGRRDDKSNDVAELDESVPPTDEKPELTEEEKKQEIEAKREILVEHGAKIKHTGKRPRLEADQPPPRRSARTKKPRR